MDNNILHRMRRKEQIECMQKQDVLVPQQNVALEMHITNHPSLPTLIDIWIVVIDIMAW